MEVTTKSRKPRKERAENAAMRRRQIIDATVRSVIKNGLAGTTLATVAAEAGLSQGVAVFYFKNKQTLLGEVLRHHYEIYQQCWTRALKAAGPDPAERLIALVRADFDPEVCDAASLVIWHAFWGESAARPHYAEIADTFDRARFETMRDVCADLLAEVRRPVEKAAPMATAIDALTDGLWLRIYLSTGEMDRTESLGIAASFLAAMIPEKAEAFIRGLAGP
jgi:TetR/AcrR family transcriptional repressor of bet genes